MVVSKYTIMDDLPICPYGNPECPSCYPINSTRAKYIGKLTTGANQGLNGKYVQIIKIDNELNVVHATFEDPTLGRWSRQAHWFLPEEIEMNEE